MVVKKEDEDGEEDEEKKKKPIETYTLQGKEYFLFVHDYTEDEDDVDDGCVYVCVYLLVFFLFAFAFGFDTTKTVVSHKSNGINSMGFHGYSMRTFYRTNGY